MIELLAEYGLFLAKVVTIVVAILFVVGGVVSMGGKHRKADHGHIEVKNLNDRFDESADSLKQIVLEEHAYKDDLKQQKKKYKVEQKQAKIDREKKVHKKRIYVLDFDGDTKASSVPKLTEEINAILTLATSDDEVVVGIESPGGMVHAYGLAASQLHRVKDHNIPLTVCVDKVAASGGYLMACIADKILAAPFAILGSIGVMAEVPNFHRLLKKYDVDFEILTAGEHKRTLTMFGQNTDKGREKFMEELSDTHELFKEYITDNRPQVNIETVATGEFWYGTRAVEQNLIDGIETKDSYLMKNRETADLYEVTFVGKQSLQEKVGIVAQRALGNTVLKLWDRLQQSRCIS